VTKSESSKCLQMLQRVGTGALILLDLTTKQYEIAYLTMLLYAVVYAFRY